MRVCQNPACPATIDHMRKNARYCSDACKTAAWKGRVGYSVQGQRKACQTRKGGQSGLQVSFAKAIDVLTVALWQRDIPLTRPQVERMMCEALSDKQRARLDARVASAAAAAKQAAEQCEVCGAGSQGRCDPPDDHDGECPHGCSPER